MRLRHLVPSISTRRVLRSSLSLRFRSASFDVDALVRTWCKSHHVGMDTCLCFVVWDSSELDRERGQIRFDRGRGWEPGSLSNPDFLRFEPEIVSDQPSVSQPDPSDKVRGSSCQISHVASPPLSRLKPVLPSGTILLRCVVSETRGVRPPPDSGARRSEREREGTRGRETHRERGESVSKIYRGGTVGVWTTIRTTRAASTHLRAANRPCEAACV